MQIMKVKKMQIHDKSASAKHNEINDNDNNS